MLLVMFNLFDFWEVQEFLSFKFCLEEKNSLEVFKFSVLEADVLGLKIFGFQGIRPGQTLSQWEHTNIDWIIWHRPQCHGAESFWQRSYVFPISATRVVEQVWNRSKGQLYNVHSKKTTYKKNPYLCTLDKIFRQITTFIKVCMTFVFELQTL